MFNLIRGTFYRLFKNKAYLLLLAFDFIISIWVIFYIRNIYSLDQFDPDELYMAALMYAPFIFSCFLPLFIGRDFSDNTIRNKILAGHSRLSIFSAAVISSSAAVILMLLIYAIPQLTLGFILIGTPVTPKKLALSFLAMIILAAFWSVLIVAAVFLIQNKAVCVVASFMTVMILVFAGVSISSSLTEPETILVPKEDSDFTLNLEPSDLIETDNPYYVSGVKRKIFEVLEDSNPAYQYVQLSELQTKKPGSVCLAGASAAALAFAAGAALFRKRNIR